MSTTPVAPTPTMDPSASQVDRLANLIRNASNEGRAAPPPPPTPASTPPEAAPAPAPPPAASPAHPLDAEIDADLAEKPPEVEAAPAEVPAEEEQQPEEAKPGPTNWDQFPQTLDQFLKNERGREIYANHKAFIQLSKSPQEGGLGHVVTPEAVKEYFGSHLVKAEMDADYLSGDPERQARLLAYWLAPVDAEGKPRPYAEKALENLEPTLASLGQEAYARVSTPILSKFENEIWNDYHSLAGNKDAQNAAYWAAQYAHLKLTGELLPQDQIPQGEMQPGQPATAPKPAAARRTTPDIDTARQQLAAERQQLAQERANEWNGSLKAAITAEMEPVLDEQLEPVKHLKDADPNYYAYLRNQLVSKLMQSAQSSTAWRLHLIRVDQARNTGSKDFKYLASDYLNLAKPAIRSATHDLLKGAGVDLKRKSDARHARIKESVKAGAAPSANGSPVTQSIAPTIQRKPGETQRDWIYRQVKETSAAR